MPEQNHHLAIKALCAKVDSNFFQVLSCSAQAACFLLADVYCFRAKAKDAEKARLCATIVKLKKQLTPSHISLLWQALGTIGSIEWNLLSRGVKRSLTVLRKAMLRQKTYLPFIDNAALLQLGKDPDWYREVFIALIRKHQWQHALPDPFIYPGFSYHLVSIGGAEQNFLYVSNFVAQCAALPVQELVLLGSHQPKVAALLLKDLTNSAGYFQVGAEFARIHPCLRATIAKDWRRLLEIFPLNKADNQYLQQVLPELKKDYPEFSHVVFDNRSTRHYQAVPEMLTVPPARAKPAFSVVMVLPAPVGLLWYLFRRLNEHTQMQREIQSQSKTTQQPIWRRLLGW